MRRGARMPASAGALVRGLQKGRAASTRVPSVGEVCSVCGVLSERGRASQRRTPTVYLRDTVSPWMYRGTVCLVGPDRRELLAHDLAQAIAARAQRLGCCGDCLVRLRPRAVHAA